MKRYRTFKVEIDPTEKQKQKIAQFQGICRFVCNLYLGENDKRWKSEKALAETENRKPKSTLMKPAKFFTWLKKEYIPETGRTWINDCPAKAICQSINNAYKAYQNFFKGLSGFPKFKKKNTNSPKVYFCRNNVYKQPIQSTRWYVQIPKLGRVHLKEKGRIPVFRAMPNGVSILKGHVCEQHGRWYLTVLVEYLNPYVPEYRKDDCGIGIDVGLKDMAVLSDGTSIININKKRPMKRKMRKYRHLQRIFSRKMEAYRKREAETKEKLGRGLRPEEFPSRKKLDKARKAMNACQRKINNAREAHRRQSAALIMKKYPSFIVMEDLNISGMMKNRKLAPAIAQVQWYAFRMDILFQCEKRGIEFRLADRFFPSSKTCPKCGHIHQDLKLSDRTFVCPECGYSDNRDLNAAKNLRDTNRYTVITAGTEMF